ncbi:MAG: hypothetical protein AAGC95_02520 [Pseudomonadota bacterium]
MRVLFVAAAAVITFFSGVSGAYALNSGWYKLSEVHEWSGVNVTILMDPAAPAHACAAGAGNTYLMNDTSATRLESKISFLLTALVADREVNLKYVCGTDNFPYVDAVRIR